jgi:hypothetical protein
MAEGIRARVLRVSIFLGNTFLMDLAETILPRLVTPRTIVRRTDVLWAASLSAISFRGIEERRGQMERT